MVMGVFNVFTERSTSTVQLNGLERAQVHIFNCQEEGEMSTGMNSDKGMRPGELLPRYPVRSFGKTLP